MIDTDKLVKGPFGSDACYEQTFDYEGENITTWLCFGSGFTTSTLMKEGSKVLEDAMATSPELYKELMHKDENGFVWLPATITLPKKGMVFLDGTGKDNWNWTAVRAKQLTSEEKKTGNFPEGQDYKMDMQNKKIYSQKDFMDAMEHIGFFSIEV